MSENTYTVNIDWTNAQSSMKNLVESLDRLNRKLDDFSTKSNQSMNKTAAGTKMAAEEMKKLNARYRELSREFDRVMSKSKKVDQGTERWRRYLQRVREINRELNVLRSKGATGVDAVTQAQGKLNNQVSLGRQLFLRLRSVMLTVFGAYAIINGIKNTINTVKEFELGMARLQAITGETKEAMDALGDINKVLAADGIFGATEIAEIQVQLAKFGFTLKEITASTGGILDLATATGEDLNSAVDLVSSSIRALGMEASETGRLVDVLGKAFTSSALDVGKFRESAKYVLPLARQMGWSIEQVAATLGKLADSGISGSLAGTGLRQMFIQLWDASSDLSAILGTGIHTFEDFYGAIEQAKKEGVSFDKILSTIPVRAKTMFTVLWNNVDAIRAMEKELNNADGAIDEMANIRLETLNGQLGRLSSSWSAMITSIGETGGVLTKIFSAFADLAGRWAATFDPMSFAISEAEDRYKEFMKTVGEEDKTKLLMDKLKDINSEIIKQERVVGDLVTEYENLNAVEQVFRSGALEQLIKTQTAALEGMKLEAKLLNDELTNDKVVSIFEKNKRLVLGATKELVAEGANELAAFTDVYTQNLSNFQASVGKMPKYLQQPYLDALGMLNAWFQKYLDGLIAADEKALAKTREAHQLWLKQIRTLYQLEESLELERNENRVQSERDRELEILRIKFKYAQLGLELDLKSGELSEKQAAIVKQKLIEIEKTFLREAFELNEKYDKKDLDEKAKKALAEWDVERAKNKRIIQELANLGVARENLKKMEIGFEIEFMAWQIRNAEMLGITEDGVKKLVEEIKGAKAEMTGLIPDEPDEIEGDTSGIEKYINDIVRLSNVAIDAWKKMVDEQVRATETIVGDLNTRIAEVQRDLEREQELYIEGYANNVTVKQKEYQDLKAIRERALKDRDAAVRRQQRIEAISQAVNIASAVSNVINQYSKIPWVGWALGTAAAAAFIGLFASSKSKINALTKYGEGGEIRGRSHTMGGVPIEAEGGEFVVRKKQYTKYKELVNAINRDDLPEINRHVVNNTNFGRSEKIVVSTKEWREIRDLLRDNLDREDERVLGAKKIISKGIKKRIVDV
jgi:TP901 family phage tail tape measure protein